MEQKYRLAGARLIFGAVAGLLATLVMNEFQKSISPKKKELPEKKDEDSSTVQVAGLAYQAMTHNQLPQNRKQFAGQIVHFSFGAFLGAIYGLLAPKKTHFKSGILYGAAVWLAADEAMLWGLGISKAPFQYPLSTHLYGLSSHLIYGASLGFLFSKPIRIDPRSLAKYQGLFYLASGLWPVFHMRSFEAVTGPKTDHWLVKTVGLFITTSGFILLRSSRIPTIQPQETMMIGAGFSSVLCGISLFYSIIGRISKIYLLDGLTEALLVAAWLAGTPHQQKHSFFPSQIEPRVA